MTLEQGVKEAARIIHVAHEDSKDKDFELEMTWVSGVDGPTKGRHMPVPDALRDEAERLAKKALEGDDEEEDEGGRWRSRSPASRTRATEGGRAAANGIFPLHSTPATRPRTHPVLLLCGGTHGHTFQAGP